MNRLAPLAIAFVLGLAAVGCSTEVTSTLPDRGDDGSEPDEANDAKTSRTAKGGGSNETPGAARDESLPAPKLLPEGAVRTVSGTCNVTANDLVVGDGKITRTTRSVKDFVSVAQYLSGDVVVEEGAGFAVQVEVDENLQDLVVAEVNEKGTLELGVKQGSTICSHGARVLVTLPKIQNAGVASAGDMEITKRTAASDVKLVVAGAGDLVFHGKAATLEVEVSGAGDVTLEEGSATSTKVTVSGAGDVTGRSFDAGTVSKSISGVGDVSL